MTLLRRFHAHALLAPLALLLLAAVSPVHAQDGTLDPSFGTGGRVTSSAAAGANATVIDSADRIVVAGEFGGNFSVARFTTAGVLDPTFGTGGSVTTDFGGSDVANAVALQPDGKIVVAGSSNGNFVLARYTTDGVLDAAFGVGGTATTDFGGAETASAVALQPDGRIVAAGTATGRFALARFTADGVLDTTFGTGGRVTTDVNGNGSASAYDLAIYADGRIVAVGDVRNSANNFRDWALARYTVDGALDPTFGSGGLVTDRNVIFTDNALRAVALDASERVVVAGNTFDPGSDDANDLVTLRYTTSGARDASFGSNGLAYMSTGNFNFCTGQTELCDRVAWEAVAIQPDGKIVMAGHYELAGPNANPDFVAGRLTPSGEPDESFNPSSGRGTVQTDLGGNDRALAVAFDSAFRIVVAGKSDGTMALARYLNPPPPIAEISPGALSVTLAPDATTTEAVTISNIAAPIAKVLTWSAALTNFDTAPSAFKAAPSAFNADPSACTPGQTLDVTFSTTFAEYTSAGAREVGQSFTVTCTGLLTSISPMTVANQSGSWSGNLRLYDGAGTTGIELAAAAVSGISQAGVGGSFTATFPTPIGVTEGQAYTWFMDLDVGPSGHPSTNAYETYPGGDAYISLNGNPSSAVDYDADVPFTATFEPGSSWVAISPTSGSVAPGTSGTLDVTFDATGLADGTYTADLVLTTNDPENPSVTVPLTLVVSAAPVACEPGFYSATGNTPCLPAPPGSFVDTPGATESTLCAAGSFQPVEGQTACLLAPPGQYVDLVGAVAAIDCALGSFQPEAGQTACLLAPIAFYVDVTAATAATACPDGQTTLGEGSTSIDDCFTPTEPNQPPVADAGDDQTVIAGQTVSLDGSGSTDPDGDPLTYSWTEDGTEIATGDTPTVTLSLGTHTLTLTVTDPDGETDTDEVIILAAPPTSPNFTIKLLPKNAPITIPAKGGSFRFAYTVKNTTAQKRSTRTWLVLTYPDGHKVRQVGPLNVTLQGGETKTWQVLVLVPKSAPKGQYTYTGFVGNFPNGAIAQHSFTFTKKPPTAGKAEEAGEEVSAWQILDEESGAVLLGAEENDLLASEEEEAESTEREVPLSYALEANYPNPFNPSTEITFALPEAGVVRVVVYDVLGREVARLIDGVVEAGIHQVQFEAGGLPSGTYLYRLEAGRYSQTRRMVLLK